jgi:hypothetical protein
MADQTFTSGQILTASQMSTLQSNSGLIVVTPTSVTNATLSGSVATIGAGVASFTISGCFTSAFSNYRIVMSNVAASADGASMKLTFNNSASTTYNTVGVNMDYASATQYPIGTAAANHIRIGESSTTINNATVDIFQPFTATVTNTNSFYNGSAHVMWYYGRDTNAVSQTAFTITPSSGTLTGGTVSVFGYR